MRGAVRKELLSSGFFPGSFLSLFFFVLPFSHVVLWRVYSVDRALMPDGVASAFVTVHPFLLSTSLAVDGSEARFDLQLLFFGFLLAPTPGAS